MVKSDNILDKFYHEVSKRKRFSRKEEIECGRKISEAQQTLLDYIQKIDPDFVYKFDQNRHYNSTTPLVSHAGDLALAYLDKITVYTASSKTGLPQADEMPGSLDLEHAEQQIRKLYSVFVSERNRMVEANLRLSFLLASKVFRTLDGNKIRRLEKGCLSMEDCLSEANINLQRAAETYDYRLGKKFVTFAYSSIYFPTLNTSYEYKQSIEQDRRTASLGQKVEKLIEEYKSAEKEVPTEEEISERLGISLKRVSAILSFPAIANYESYGHSEYNSPFSNLADKETEKLREKIITSLNLKKLVRQKRLTAQEVKVLTRRFGLDGREGCSSADIAAEEGLKIDRVRYIERASLKKLRKLLINQHGLSKEGIQECFN